MQQDYLQIRVLELAPLVYVSKQLFEHDVRLLAKQGVRSLVDNRPADEAMEQPSSADLAKVAEELGMTFVHFAVDPKSITDEDLEAFTKCCEELERPLLLFSRTGSASTKIWEMTESP
ncbi:MAG: sulfur transferase domain-containing protein [Woeseiaceae bacterium]